MAGLVGEDQPVRRMVLEDRDDAPDVRAVGPQRCVQVDHLRGVRVDTGRVRVGDEVDDVVAGEVHLPVRRGERVPQVGGPVGDAPVTLYGVRRGRPRHADPVTERMRAQGEPAVGGAFEEAGGGREVVGRQFGGCRQGGRVREGQEDHDRVEFPVRARIGGVPGVQTLGVMGSGPFEGARRCVERFGDRGTGGQGGRGERRHRGEHGCGAAQSGPVPQQAHPTAQGERTRHGDLRERFAGHRTQPVSDCRTTSCSAAPDG